MRINRLGLSWCVGAALLCGGLVGRGVAQTNVPQLPANTEPLLPVGSPHPNRVIRLQHVKPSLIAWWLDPQHNVEPQQLKDALALNGAAIRVPLAPFGGDAQQPLFVLPAGVTQLVSVDPQNVLLVVGTDEGFEKLKELVELLDLQALQLEIEAQTIQLTPQVAQALGVTAPRQTKAPAPFTISLSARAQQDLTQLIAGQQATLIDLYHTPVDNNGFTSFSLKVRPQTPQLPNQVMLISRWVLDITPTLNGDGTYTLSLQQKNALMMLSTVRTNEPFSSPRLLPAAGGNAIVVNLRASDAVVLAGLTVPRFTIKDNVIRDDIEPPQLSDTIIVLRVRLLPAPTIKQDEVEEKAPIILSGPRLAPFGSWPVPTMGQNN